MKKYIDAIQEIAFFGLVTFIFLIISLEFLEWTLKFSFQDGILGIFYSSLNIFQKLTILWFFGIPLYLVKIIFEKR